MQLRKSDREKYISDLKEDASTDKQKRIAAIMLRDYHYQKVSLQLRHISNYGTLDTAIRDAIDDGSLTTLEYFELYDERQLKSLLNQINEAGRGLEYLKGTINEELQSRKANKIIRLKNNPNSNNIE